MSFDHIFDELEISTDPFALCELRGACDLGLGGDTTVTLHYILSGEGQISIRGRPPLRVARGNLVLIPALQSHALHSFGQTTDPIPDCKPAALNLAHVLEKSPDIQHEQSQLTALCSHVNVGLRGAEDIISLIREPLVENVFTNSAIKPLLDGLLDEISNPRLGSRAMIRTILTQCMIDLLRQRIMVQDESMGWMAALKDQSVWNALRAMLDSPGDAHTVDSLASTVGMSRSAFAKRFSDSYGSGPMELLRELRMKMAGSLLRDSDLPVKRIAEIVGFTSRSAFSRMFEIKTGQNPREFRANARGQL